jgi:hypothetical protein
MCLEYIVNQMCDKGSLEHIVKTDLKFKKMHHVFFFLIWATKKSNEINERVQHKFIFNFI